MAAFLGELPIRDGRVAGSGGVSAEFKPRSHWFKVVEFSGGAVHRAGAAALRAAARRAQRGHPLMVLNRQFTHPKLVIQVPERETRRFGMGDSPKVRRAQRGGPSA
ncbi:MAG TPA: hypothetical protein VFV67_08675 [Actinophytocola sp.]|uniref:hypothetical protein n=1 Tax=Actinophytocola sp. TaxID=1872138 RepID=UPI002DB5C9B4|nr:hypothetical protein [Actinophytocola sp.]HEU5470714.1 hypothetical protein [Actinophytocola sp.]